MFFFLRISLNTAWEINRKQKNDVRGWRNLTKMTKDNIDGPNGAYCRLISIYFSEVSHSIRKHVSNHDTLNIFRRGQNKIPLTSFMHKSSLFKWSSLGCINYLKSIRYSCMIILVWTCHVLDKNTLLKTNFLHFN